MSICISDLSFHYSAIYPLFRNLHLTIEKKKKISLIGVNGTGKSTLLKLIAGELEPLEGMISCASTPYYIPQHTGKSGKTVAEILRVDRKLAALHAIEQGSLCPSDYDILADDWEIESRCKSALSHWFLPDLPLDHPADALSGGELTKVYLAGLRVHSPEIILLDEPTNHLDQTARNLLYQYINQSAATLVVVSHDRTLLDQLDTTCELTASGIHLFGGNYAFYQAQKALHEQALEDRIQDREKTIRASRKQAQEVKQRQEKRTAVQGAQNKTQVPRAMRNLLRNSAEETASRAKGVHSGIIARQETELQNLKQQREVAKELKLDFDPTVLPAGKLLVEAREVNFSGYHGVNLWPVSPSFTLYSHDRIHLKGDNGTGKTTLLQLVLGTLAPSQGTIRRQEFSSIYLDQNYSVVDTADTVETFAMRYNVRNLEEHEVKLRLNRFLFTASDWSKKCQALSGGEKMRLYLCGLMIGNQTPDLIVLDEPTNNLDLPSMQILTETIRHYRGSLIVVSHDARFVQEIGLTQDWIVYR